jgi:hypothetical protein
MDDVDPTDDFPKEIHNEQECDKLYSLYCSLFNSLKIINCFINDILFLIVNFVIDITLLNQYGKFLNNKEKISNASLEARNENKNKKKRITRMVLIASTLFFVSHFPEFISSILLLVYSKKLSRIFDYHLSTNLINDEAQVFTLISISFQFYVLIKFNNNFHVGFKHLFKKKTIE